jgi:hypothetical protein
MSRYSQSVAEIVEDAFCKGETVLLPQVFVDASCRAELDAGAAVCFFGAKAACNVFSALCFEVGGDLAGEIGIAGAAAEEAEQFHAAPSSSA